MTKKPRLTTILPLAAVAMFASASVSNAAPVVYYLTTVDSGGLGGTLTFDSAIDPTSTDEETGNLTYTHPTGALPAFSFVRDGSEAEFDQTDGVYELYLITDASFTPLFLKIDIDDTTPVGPANDDFIFVEGDGLDFTTGLGQYQPGAVDVTGATLTPATGSGSVAITSITSKGGDTWELMVKGEAEARYEFRSSTTLEFSLGTLVAPLAPGTTPVGTISGDDSSVLTTDEMGLGTVQMDLIGPANFVLMQTAPAPPPPPLQNGSFEEPTAVDDTFAPIGTPWQTVDVPPGVGFVETWNPPVTEYASAPDGENVCDVFFDTSAPGASFGVLQVLGETFAADTDYTVTVQVGRPTNSDWPGFRVELRVGDTVLAFDEDPTTTAPTAGNFITSTVTYTYDAGDEGLVGQDLEVRLLSRGVDVDGVGAAGEWVVDFDDVTFSSTGP